MELNTIKELQNWLVANCYNNRNYAIGDDQSVEEGAGLDSVGKIFGWYYIERGEKRYEHYFSNEKEAVEFALERINSDKDAFKHLIGFVKDDIEKQELILELTRRQIVFDVIEIPYGGFHDMRTLVSVFGCDIKKVQDLKTRYIPLIGFDTK